MRRVLLLGGTILLAVCGTLACGPQDCAAGDTQNCACPQGGAGVQVCGGDGTWGSCSCRRRDVNNNNNPTPSSSSLASMDSSGAQGSSAFNPVSGGSSSTGVPGSVGASSWVPPSSTVVASSSRMSSSSSRPPSSAPQSSSFRPSSSSAAPSSSRPPVPSSWTCMASYYGTADGCDCGCNAPDPDCNGLGCSGVGCAAQACQFCYDATGATATCPTP